MPSSSKRQSPHASAGQGNVATPVTDILAELNRRGSARNVDGMARYGIMVANGKIFGVSVGTLRDLGKRLGRDHALAAALWDTEWYEARMLAAFVDEPARVTPAQMERWCRDFDNWAICDHCCFHLFDKTPHAWTKITQWAKRKPEFERRAAFALIASLGVHDKQADDSSFSRCLPMIERAATDNRNFVKKGVSWALRVVGRRSPALHARSVALAKRLAASKTSSSSRWIGNDALRDLSKPAVLKRLAAKR
jgi:3-methyladenine DNA glycosylase AlkD